MAALPIIGQLAGGGISAYATIKQGQAARDAAYSNAEMDEYNADVIDEQGRIAVKKQQREVKQSIGAARGQYAASGIRSDEGSALDILQESAAQGALDSMILKNDYDVKAYGYRKSAQTSRYQGDEAYTASKFSAAGQLLGSVGKAFSKA